MSELLDQFERISVANKIAILIFLMVAIFIAFYFIVYSGQQDDISRAQRTLDQERQRLAELVAEAEDIERLRTEVAQLCDWQQVFMERLPPERGVSSLLRSLQQQAQVTGLNIEQSQIQADVSGPNYTTVPVTLNLVGTYDQVSDFFDYIGRQPRIMNVRNIALSPAGAGRRHAETGAPLLSVACNLATYYSDPARSQGVEACN